MRNRLIRGAGFLLILLILVEIMGVLFQPKNNTQKAGMNDYLANGILGEPKDTIDVVFLGDSEAFCAFLPLRIWENAGITSYVSSVVDQKFYEIPEYLKRAFQNQTPGMIFVETNALYRGSSGVDMLSYYAQLALPALRYHDRWKKMRSYDWFSLPEYTEVYWDKGYHYSLVVEPADTSEYMIPTEEAAPIPSRNLRILSSMERYCRERGAQLVLVSTPSTQNWDYYRHNAVTAAAQELGIPYVDMNCLQEEIPINWETDTMDAGDHMNYFGTIKVTDYITDYLVQSGKFTDKRLLPEYEIWNDFARQFREFLAIDGIIE